MLLSFCPVYTWSRKLAGTDPGAIGLENYKRCKSRPSLTQSPTYDAAAAGRYLLTLCSSWLAPCPLRLIESYPMSLLPTSRAGSGAKYSSLPTNGEIGNASYDSDIANGESVEMTSSGSAGIGLINGGQRGGKRRNGSNLRAMLLRPRTFVVCIVGLAITVLVVHDDSRIAAHSALKNAGVPLPDSLDDVRTGLNKWYEGHGTSTWLPSSSSGSGSGSKETEPDDGIEWEDTAAPHSSTSWNSPDEPLIDKMTYHHSNGYLILPDPSKDKAIKPSEEERHPILELIENAERKWDALVKKQSKTLKEAVAEYKRRYKRNPPRGFDKW